MAREKWELAKTYHRWATAIQHGDKIKCKELVQQSMDEYLKCESYDDAIASKPPRRGNSFDLKKAFLLMEKNQPFVLQGPDVQ